MFIMVYKTYMELCNSFIKASCKLYKSFINAFFCSSMHYYKNFIIKALQKFYKKVVIS